MSKPLRTSYMHDVAAETRSAAVQEAFLGASLRRVVKHAHTFAARTYRLFNEIGIDPASVLSIADLQRLPVTRKDDLGEIQKASLPFGGLNAVVVDRLARIFMSPGNIYEPQGQGEDFWRFAPGMTAAGFRKGDIIQNTFSYHLTPAGFMFDGAARSLGCVVVPAGTGQTDLQVQIAADVGVTGYTGTPSFLYALLKRGREVDRKLNIEVAFVSGEMLPNSLRDELENDFGVRVLQGYGIADLGLVAYECAEKKGMHLHHNCIVEIIDIATGNRCAPGEVGEVVVTVFDEAYPLIRFGTGDLSSVMEEATCACGRTSPRLAGWLGRVGDAVKVRGLFIRGSQIDGVMKNFPEVVRYQAIVTREDHRDELHYCVELKNSSADSDLTTRLADALREQVKVRGKVDVVAAGAIAPDAKKIDDRRVWK